jgi:DNA adenine methylase
MVPDSRALFRDAVPGAGATEIQRAALWLYRNLYGFGGDGRTYGPIRKGSRSSMFFLRRLSAFARRIDRVAVESLPYERCVALYDSTASLFFCDPPYTSGEVAAYAPWTIPDVQRLRDVLFGVKGRWIVTLNDCPEIRSIFSGCRLRPVSTHANLARKARPRRFEELIVTPS